MKIPLTFTDFAEYLWDDIESLLGFIKRERKRIQEYNFRDRWGEGRISMAKTEVENLISRAKKMKIKNPYRKFKIEERKNNLAKTESK